MPEIIGADTNTIPSTTDTVDSTSNAQPMLSPEEHACVVSQAKKWHSTTKSLLWFVMINGIAWIWCSYILAWFDKVQIAESLSSNVCTVVLGQIFGYLITKTVENIFKYNNFGGKSKYTE